MVALGIVCSNFAQAVDVEPYLRRSQFNDIKLSPTGEYYAATVPFEGTTALVILRRSDGKILGNFGPGKPRHVHQFRWVSDDRVVFSLSEKFGALDQPYHTGELFGMDADGGQGTILVGVRVNTQTIATHIWQKVAEEVSANLVDALPSDDKNVLVEVELYTEEPYARLDRMDVYTGLRKTLARARVRNAEFTTNANGQVRFAHGSGADRAVRL